MTEQQDLEAMADTVARALGAAEQARNQFRVFEDVPDQFRKAQAVLQGLPGLEARRSAQEKAVAGLAEQKASLEQQVTALKQQVSEARVWAGREHAEIRRKAAELDAALRGERDALQARVLALRGEWAELKSRYG